MEYLTKWVVAVPLRSFDTSSIVQALLYEVVLKYGLPTRAISDNGTNYISKAMNVNAQDKFGYSSWRWHEDVVNPKTYTTQKWSEFLNEKIPIIHAKALENMKKAQDQQAKQYDKKTKSLVKFKVGDLVLRKNYKIMSFPKERWTGPWRVLEVTNKAGTAYKISKAEDPKAMSTVNVIDLRLFVRRGNDVLYPATVGAANSRPS